MRYSYVQNVFYATELSDFQSNVTSATSKTSK